MDSLISKTGKMRSLVRDLETKYDDPAAASFPSRIFHSTAKIHWIKIDTATLCHPASLDPLHQLPRCVTSLKTQIQKIDDAYDQCMTAWSKGEAEGFFTQGLLNHNLKDWCNTLDNKTNLSCVKNYMNLNHLFWVHWFIDFQLRFQTVAEDKMKAATYLSNPHEVSNAKAPVVLYRSSIHSKASGKCCQDSSIVG